MQGPPSDRIPEARTFKFNNLMEQTKGTNPRVADENGDGVAESWAVFWHDVYPLRVRDAVRGDQEAADEVGTLVPTEVEIVSIREALANPLGDLGGHVKANLHYVRFFEVLGTPASARSQLRPGETLAIDPPLTIQVLRDGFRVPAVVAEASGSKAHGFADDEQLGLNPYLLDTDGDGLSDAWEAFAGRCSGVGGTNPIAPDATDDPEGDGLENAGEQESGTSPCSADTDLGGVADGVEVGVQGLSALEPGDDASPQEDRPDDGDRLPLDEELRLGTDPNDPDSDQDGLLDGDDVEFLLSTLDDETGPLVAHLLARGVASERLEGGSAGPKVRFLGEAPNRGDPRGLDTSGDGIPDGWLAYYTGRADVPRSELMARYECGRPAWWDESRVGVWWWGAPPLAPEGCHGDMDYDGLLDNTGEDPIPASSHGNLLPPGVPRLPYDLTPSLSGIELLVAGQRQGECAGDPRPCRSEWPARSYFGDRPDAQDRAPVEFSEVDTSLATAPDGLLRMGKEEEFQVRGRLGLACGTPCDGAPGLSNRTVVAELVDSSGSARTLGVGFTGPSGRFEIRSCLCLSGAAEVPYPDVVALGQSSGRVEWTSDPRNVEVGSLPLLTIRSYATTATFYSGTRPNASHPQYVELDIGAETYHATASAGHSVGTVHITSGTALAIDTPQTIPFTDGGRTLTVGVSLVDRSGAGVPFQRVAVEAVGIGMTNPTTGASGTAVATFQIPPARVASVIVRATYSGDSVAGLGPAAPAGPASVELQAPLTLVVEAPGAPVRSGEVFATSVLVQSRGQPVEGIAVRAVIGSFAGEAMSGASGIAVFALQPTGFGGSVSHVTFDVEETLAYQGASVTSPLEVVAGVLLTATVPASIGEGNASKVLGRLTLLDGSPVSGETVRLTIGGSPAGIASTGQDGRWETVLLVPAGLGAGRASMQVEFGGRTGELEPAALSREIRVVVTTQITTPPVKGGQGGIVDIKGRLTDVSGRGVAGHWVLVDVDGHRQGTALTSSGGGFGFRYSIPGNSTVAVHLVKTTFDGSPNGTYGPSFTTTTLHVGAPTVLVLAPPSALLRGNNTLVATLRGPDDVPLTNAQVTFTSSTGGHVVSTTDPTGRAAPTFAFNPPTVGQAITIQAAFAGSTLQGPATDQATVPLRVPTRIIMSVDSEAGRGAPLRIRTVLLDDTDRRLLGETLSFSLLGTTVETASTDGEEVLMEVPREAPLGNSSLEVAYPGGEFLLEAAALRQIVIKEGARLAIGPLPRDVVADQAFEVRIRLTDSQGVPLVGRTVGVRMSHQSIAAIVTTGPDGNGTAILASPVAGAGSVVAFFPGEEFLAAQSATSDPLQIKASAAPSGSRATGLVMAFAALVMLVGGILVARVLLRRRASVLSILHAAERSISAGNPWSAAVLLAYRRLTVHLAGQGFRERPSESVREFVQELATRVALPTDAAIDLVRLFEAGRYGGMELDAGHARWARLALRRVIHAIESHVEVPPSGSDGGTVVP
ncbi:MAG: DUF4129 domain-containing protein [Euryarchaeota archaeon]|nr:DUF4129 domain-containing protein [Euryarchaeota archaeon]